MQSRTQLSFVVPGTCLIRNNECKRNGWVVDSLEFLEGWVSSVASLLKMLPRIWVKVGIQSRELRKGTSCG